VNTLQTRKNSDTLGMIASALCLAHCLLTPFIFVAQTGAIVLQDIHPGWWKSLDIIFLGLSLIAIRKSAKLTSKMYMKYAFWICWILLFAVIINEKLSIFPIPEEITYIISLSLVGLHFYNLKYCQC